MPDREKVIKGIHDARRYLEDREWVDKSVGVHIDALNDALALLKKQEPQKEKIPEYPCKNCCSPSERAACCGCEKERQWQTKYGKQEGR